MKSISNWAYASIDDVCEVIVSNVDKKTITGEIPVRLCNYLDVYNNREITDNLSFMDATATPMEIERFRLLTGDVVITKDSESPDDIAVPSCVKEAVASDLVCGYHLAILRPKKKDCLGSYISRLLALPNVNRHFAKRATGSTRYGLSLDAIKTTPIHLPPLPEQHAIAEVLDTVDTAIRRTEDLIRKLQATKQGMLHDLLTRGVDAHGQLRPTYAEAPRLYKQSPLGWIPKEWEVRALGEFMTGQSGKTPSRSNASYYSSNGIPWIKSGELNRSEVCYTEESISEKAVSDCSMPLVPANTTLIAMYGATAGVVSYLKIEATMNQAVLALIDAKCDQRFLYWMLGFFSSKILSSVQGSGQPNLSKDVILSTKVFIPQSIVEQIAIRNALDQYDNEIRSEKSSLSKQKSLKQALMTDLLTGKVRTTSLLRAQA